MEKRLLVVVGAALLTGFLGCGGNGGPPGGGQPATGETVSLGTLQVGVDSAAALKTVLLRSPQTSRLTFTALYGTRIVRLQQMGYGRIAFASTRTGNYEIFAINADGSGATNLSRRAATELAPSWSPDGRQLAFESDRRGNYEIYVMNAGGTGQTRLTRNGVQDTRPSWSPNGRKIAFDTSRDGNAEIYVMNADGSGQTNLTKNGASDFDPSWSPDGRQIAFTSTRTGDYEICVMNADGSGQTNLTKNGADDSDPSWSPDGRQIAFASLRDGNWEIHVMNADGSGPTNLTQHAADDSAPSWSPDGRQVAFTTYRDGNNEIYVMNADGSGQTNLTKNGAPDSAPSWSPAPSVRRSLIGANGSDEGKNPPFGTARPLAIVGLNADGLVSATTVGMSRPNWPSLRVAALNGTGTDLAGAKITGTNIRRVVEDVGRGLPTRTWAVSGSPSTGTVLVFFSTDTGKVSSVLASADTALADGSAQLAAGRLLVSGSFTEVYTADDPGRNLVSGPTTQVSLDSHTGEVVATN